MHLVSGYYYYDYVVIGVLRPSWLTEVHCWIVQVSSTVVKFYNNNNFVHCPGNICYMCFAICGNNTELNFELYRECNYNNNNNIVHCPGNIGYMCFAICGNNTELNFELYRECTLVLLSLRKNQISVLKTGFIQQSCSYYQNSYKKPQLMPPAWCVLFLHVIFAGWAESSCSLYWVFTGVPLTQEMSSQHETEAVTAIIHY